MKKRIMMALAAISLSSGAYANDLELEIRTEQDYDILLDFAGKNEYYDFSMYLEKEKYQLEDVAYDCNADCGAAARFRYPCPTFGNPGRKCTGKNHVKYAACEADKAVSCRLWNATVNALLPKVKPTLSRRFNASTYREAKESDRETIYFAECQAAAIALCVAAGHQVGGGYGAVIAGAGGTFVASQICLKSMHW